jgi:PPM family protein phosphatase
MATPIISEQFFNTKHEQIQHVELGKSRLSFFTTSARDHVELNQDSIGFFYDPENNTTIILLADGMGGHSEGEKASKAVVQGILSELKKAKETGPIASIIEAIDNVHKRIQKNWNDAGTTLSVAEINDKTVRFYSIGDSPALLLSNTGEVLYRSNLHSPKDFALKSGLFTEKSIMQKEQDHYVSNVVGIDDYFVEVSPSLKLSKGDIVLIASDGLFDKNFNYSFSFSMSDQSETLLELLHVTTMKDRIFDDDTSFLFYQKT